VGGDVHPFFPRMNVTRQTSRRPHRAPNQQPTYSSNGPIFMQLAPHSTDQSTLLNGSIFMLHSLFTSWTSNSILQFLACVWQAARTTGHQLSTPSTALFMVHARKGRMELDALFVLSWHHGTGTYSSLFSWEGFHENLASSSNPFATIYTYGYIVNMGASWSMES
jgi:hypothetical protein